MLIFGEATEGKENYSHAIREYYGRHFSLPKIKSMLQSISSPVGEVRLFGKFMTSHLPPPYASPTHSRTHTTHDAIIRVHNAPQTLAIDDQRDDQAKKKKRIGKESRKKYRQSGMYVSPVLRHTLNEHLISPHLAKNDQIKRRVKKTGEETLDLSLISLSFSSE